jgi:hypothetical protein
MKHPLPPAHPMCRCVIMVRPFALPRRRIDLLVDLLDMPGPDRAVLIEVIRGLPPLAQENSPC